MEHQHRWKVVWRNLVPQFKSWSVLTHEKVIARCEVEGCDELGYGMTQSQVEELEDA